MGKINFQKAYYIKLGQGGEFAKNSIENGFIRFGYDEIITDIILRGDEEEIKQEAGRVYNNKNRNKYFNALWNIINADEQVLFITFYDSKLWYCFGRKSKIKEDNISRYKETQNGWKCKNVKEEYLYLSEITGKITKKQRFQGTLSEFQNDDLIILKNLINCEHSEEFLELQKIKKDLVVSVAKCIQKLHWKDFEILVDLIFRHSGWKRVSLLGGNMADIDLELQAPITNNRYCVQVKSQSNKEEFIRCAENFSGKGYEKLYFFVHNPKKDLEEFNNTYNNIELVFKEEIAKIAIEAGLMEWLAQKSSV